MTEPPQREDAAGAERRVSAEAVDIDGAQAYEDLLVPQLFAPSSWRAVSLADVRSGERVLDVACGTGIGARLAAPGVGAAGHVVGVDTDLGMLHVAQRAFPQAWPPVHWLRASAMALPLADRSFDVCLCLQGLQFFADRAQALREMRRVLGAGGRLVLSTWGPLDTMPGHRAVYAALERQGVDTASPRRGFTWGDAGALARLADRAGFERIDVTTMTEPLTFASARRFVEGLLGGAPYTRRAIAGLAPRARAECLDEACAALAPFESAAGLRLPAHVNLLHARRG